MVMDKARWQAAPRGVSKRHSLMALRILTPMGREPQKLFISREVHGSTVPFFFSPGPEPAIEGQYTLILGYGEPSIRGQRYSDLVCGSTRGSPTRLFFYFVSFFLPPGA